MEKFPEDNLLKEKTKQSKEKDKNNNLDAIIEENYLPSHITKYGKEIGLPNLKLKENVVSLCFSDSINVDIIYNEKVNQCFSISYLLNSK